MKSAVLFGANRKGKDLDEATTGNCPQIDAPAELILDLNNSVIEIYESRQRPSSPAALKRSEKSVPRCIALLCSSIVNGAAYQVRLRNVFT